MATNSYFKQLFRCTNKECNHGQKEYIWASDLQSEIYNVECTLCHQHMIPEFEEVVQAPGIITTVGSKQMSQSQQAQRKARNKAKFKTDGMAQMEHRDTDAFNHHKKKLGYKS